MSNDLKKRAEQIRDERTLGGNTAERVGGVLVELVKNDDQKADKELSNVENDIVAQKAGVLTKADKDLSNVNKEVAQSKVGICESEYVNATNNHCRFVALKIWDDGDNNRSIGITSEGEPFITLLDPDDNPERMPLALADLSNVYKTASSTEKGLMLPSDKQKLDTIRLIEIDLNIADGTPEVANANSNLPFLGNFTFNDIIYYITSGIRYLFYYKYVIGSDACAGSFSFKIESNPTRKISFSNLDNSVSLIMEEVGSGMSVEIAAVIP